MLTQKNVNKDSPIYWDSDSNLGEGDPNILHTVHYSLCENR